MTTTKKKKKAPATSYAPVNGEAETLNLPKAEWTIMIYMAGDNDLTDPGILALADLRQLDTGNSVHVSVQLDPSDDRMKTQRLVINRKSKNKDGKVRAGAPGALTDDAIIVPDGEPLPGGKVPFLDSAMGRAGGGPPPPSLNPNETDTADPRTLFDFISWTKDNCPANHYMLVLSGHSAGVEEGFLMKDDDPPGAMSFQNLVNVLKQVRAKEKDGGLDMKLDILGMDSCLMNMAEICFELKGLITFIVGAQGFVPTPGWPYRRIVAALTEQDAVPIDVKDFARQIVSEYIEQYLENSTLGGLSVDLGVLDVDASSEVAQEVGKLVDTMLPRLADKEFQKAIVYAHWATQSYNGELFVDLHDFCQMLIESLANKKGKSKAPRVSKACAAVQAAIKKMVVLSCFSGIDCQHSHGLSIYFPWSVIFDSYKNLKFTQEEYSNWMGFLKVYVEETRREPRGGPARKNIPCVERDFITFAAPFDKDVGRRTPPEGHGPSCHVHSMRNPPREWTSKGTSECTDGAQLLNQLFKSVR